MRKELKYLAGLVFCNVYRILRIFPNNDPVMGCALPFARQGKWWHALLFPMIAMISFDFITMRVGIWTWGTALAYGLVGLLAYKYFKGKEKVGLKTYAGASIAGVLIFDFLTGPIMSSFAFGIPFYAAFIGQIPFTVAHLISATSFTLALAPVLDPVLRASVSETVSKNLHRVVELFSGPFLEG
jgi:hypothetical protein